MLATIGVASVEELFTDIPRSLRASPLALPGADSELELAARLRGLADRNRTDLASFLLVDLQRAALGVVTERQIAAHPHALGLGGGDLVADALAGDLALELGEGQQQTVSN